MAKVNLGVFLDRVRAEEAINDLEKAGYNPKDMSIMVKDLEAAREVADTTGVNVAEGMVSGATTGGMLGGVAGLLIGLGAIAIPGVGALLIGGPIATALGLTGAAATTVSGAITGALAGGLVGVLVGLGVPEETARVYEDRIRDGGVLLAVPEADGDTSETRRILEEHGAEQIRTLNLDSYRLV